jgi:hypothetical protein
MKKCGYKMIMKISVALYWRHIKLLAVNHKENLNEKTRICNWCGVSSRSISMQ